MATGLREMLESKSPEVAPRVSRSESLPSGIEAWTAERRRLKRRVLAAVGVSILVGGLLWSRLESSGPGGTLPDALPLTLVWLEDPDTPDFETALLDRPTLRQHVAAELLPALVRAPQVRAIALDFTLADSPGREGLEAYQAALRLAHLRSPPVPVVAVTSSAPLIGECSALGGHDCFDALLLPHFEDPPLEEENWTLQRLDACVGGQASFARVLRDWLHATGEPGQTAAPPVQTTGCLQEHRVWQLYPAGAHPWNEVSSAELARGQRLGELREVIVVGSRSPHFLDLRTVTTPEGVTHPDTPGAVLQATAAALLLGSGSSPAPHSTP